MALTMLIPDEVLETIRLPGNRIESELIREMAYTLYQREEHGQTAHVGIG